MIEPRLSADMKVKTLLRLVNQNGGFGAVLKKGDRIEIRGFGSFVMRNYDAYTGRNPKTGKSIPVSPKKLPLFKVGKELREKVNKS